MFIVSSNATKHRVEEMPVTIIGGGVTTAHHHHHHINNYTTQSP